ncbi:MAG: FAD-binding oxidoreductase [Gammaproteobacteria bacterium]|nr:FAD-binding oxidoreductase [Gammaproteobacteria bacterium]
MPDEPESEPGYPRSWYAATANETVLRPALRGSTRADVCVIGGGYTGLSAALHLAERGYAVVLLEARRVGWGAAGRNGGQVGSGQRVGEAELEGRFGRETAHRLWSLAEEAKALVRERVMRHHIDCDLTPGQLVVAAKSAHARDLRARAEKLARDYDYPHARFIAAGELPGMLDSRTFYGGLLDQDAFHLHPLDLALGLARACEAAGVRIHEETTALGYTQHDPATVRTAGGEVVAGQVVLACDGYLGGLEPRIASRMMPINNFMVATAPLGAARARGLIRDRVCVHDTRFVVNYFRLSADDRLLFGGGENYRAGFPPDIAAFVRPYLLKIFPQLRDLAIDFAWGGTLGISRTRLPHLGRLPPNLYFAHGFSGHGISIGMLAGRLIAEAVAGSAERFDVLAGLPAPRWPGGALLRQPLLALGMLWYALRDRL